MINPSIINLLYSTKFVVSTIDTVLIMSASMVLNDLYDLEIDRVNSPNRPLVNGEIKISEAFLLVALLLGVVEYLTLNYLSETSQLIVQLIIIKINVYTPILIRILVIKNISCASLVAFSIFFTGLSITNTIMVSNKNFSLLLIAMSIVFFGSWSNELILDMRDIIGDKKNNIATIPTIFGNKFSWIFTNIVLYYGIISNTLSLSYLYSNSKLALTVTIILSPLLVSLYNIKKENYSNQSITNYMKYSNVNMETYPMYLVYFD
jgi:geranylgeranylglycerol-phosphate geranylgeranyltransferase